MNKHLSIAMSGGLHQEVCARLIRNDLQEDLCFALWFPSEGHARTTALIEQIVWPRTGDRKIHGNVGFMPAYLDRAMEEAIKVGAGLALMHTHLTPGWQGMSPDDVVAEERHAPSIFGATGFPLVGLTLGTDGSWSGRFWERTGYREYERNWCESVRVLGDALSITFDERQKPVPEFREEQKRTVSAWGEMCQADLGRLSIGIVGAGSVGSIVAESLARIGISDIKLIDFDLVETINLDRLLHATRKDIGNPKVSVLAKAIVDTATAKKFIVKPLQMSVTEEAGFREALDCDLIFSCVDRPWPRYVLNFLAYAHLIPVIDGGIHVSRTPSKKIRGADWKSHVVGPGKACLECLGQYSPVFVTTEREGYLDDPTYIETLDEDHELKRNENVFAFSLSLASFEILQMLSLIVKPAGIPDMGQKTFHFVSGKLEEPKFEKCDENCMFSSDFIAKGDSIGLAITGPHAKAEAARAERKFNWMGKIHSLFRILKNYKRR